MVISCLRWSQSLLLCVLGDFIAWPEVFCLVFLLAWIPVVARGLSCMTSMGCVWAEISLQVPQQHPQHRDEQERLG